MRDQRATRRQVITLFSPHLIAASLCWVLLLNDTVWAQSPWKFIVVGDTRGTSMSNPINNVIVSELANEIVRHGARFVIIPGDLAYSGSAMVFKSWKDLMAPVYTAGIKVLPVLGNHDINAVAPWQQIFGPDIPDNGPAGEKGRTYYYSRDNVLVLGLDTYINTGRINQTWVDNVLATNTLPHVFAFGHMPAFKANHTDCLDNYPRQRDLFWNSLKSAKVRAYFSGHDHFYDHARIDDGDGNANNDLHQLIVGSGGAPLHAGYSYNGDNSSWTPVNQFHEARYGYSLVEIDGPNVTMTFYHRTGPNAYAPTSDVWSYSVSGAPVAAASAVPTSSTSHLPVSFNNSGATVNHASFAAGTPQSANNDIYSDSGETTSAVRR